MRQYIDIVKQTLLAEQEIVEAIEVPETHYGYWILPDGAIKPVYYFQHGTVMRSLNDDLMNYSDAFRLGWVRVVAEGDELTIETTTGIISPAALMAIQAMSRQPQFFRFSGEIGEHYKTLDDPKLFIGFVRRSLSDPVVSD